MPYGNCEILIEETKELGTRLEDLTKGSRKKIVIQCKQCNVKIIRAYKGYSGVHRCKSIIDNKKKCFKCTNKKSIDEFAKNRNSHDGYSKICKECYSNYGCVKRHYKNKSLAIKNDIKKYFHMKYLNLKSRCIVKEIAFDLEEQTLYELYEKQNHRCYYSGLEIKHNLNYVKYDSISIDRKDPSKGYTKENIVLSAFCINSFKGERTEQEFRNMLKIILQNLKEFCKGENNE